MNQYLRVLALFPLLLSICSTQAQTHTWSSNACKDCQSTVVYPKWYSDGTGLTGEWLPGNTASVLTAVSSVEDYLVVTVGFGSERGPDSTFKVKDAVVLESDSAPQMVLYPLPKAPAKWPKNDVAFKKQFKGNLVTIAASKSTAGFLFFPGDTRASQITIVVAIGGETFRFPFARDPDAPAKFVDPAQLSHTRALSAAAKTAPSDSVASTNTSAESFAKQSPAGLGGLGTPRPPGSCKRNISFAVAEGGQPISRVPDFAAKWVKKNEYKYAETCFSQNPIDGVENYVMVFSRSQSAFDGIYPTVRHTSFSSIVPVNGSGTVSNAYGSTWNYTYSGTITTTTTRTTRDDLPYTDTTNSLYIYSYSERGTIVSRRSRSITTRQGGESYNTLGYNVGAALFAIGMKERLLKDAVSDIAR